MSQVTMKLFQLIEKDKILAEGCIYSSGRVAVEWLGPHRSCAIWNNITEFNIISGLINGRSIKYLN